MGPSSQKSQCYGNECNVPYPRSAPYGSHKVLPTVYGGRGLYYYQGYARVQKKNQHRQGANYQMSHNNYQPGLKPIKALALADHAPQYPVPPAPRAPYAPPHYRNPHHAMRKPRPHRRPHGRPRRAHGRRRKNPQGKYRPRGNLKPARHQRSRHQKNNRNYRSGSSGAKGQQRQKKH